MKHTKKVHYQVPLATVLGVAGYFCRRELYARGMDGRGLLIRSHPLALVLGGLMLAALVLGVISVRGQKGSGTYAENFTASLPATLGCFALAWGTAMAVLLPTEAARAMSAAWTYLALGAAVSLLVAGVCRAFGKKPPFLCLLVTCLFLLTHLVAHYRGWSSDPQILDNLFDLLGAVGLMLFAYHYAAFAAGNGNRRGQRLTGLLSVTVCLVALSGSEYPWLYLGGAIFAATNLCLAEPMIPEEGEEP